MNNSKKRLLIVEDEFIAGNDLRMMLIKGGHEVAGMAASVEQASILIVTKKPDWVLPDNVLKTSISGIEPRRELHAQMQKPGIKKTHFPDEADNIQHDT